MQSDHACAVQSHIDAFFLTLVSRPKKSASIFSHCHSRSGHPRHIGGKGVTKSVSVSVSVSVPILLLLLCVFEGPRCLRTAGQRLRDPRWKQLHSLAICYCRNNVFCKSFFYFAFYERFLRAGVIMYKFLKLSEAPQPLAFLRMDRADNTRPWEPH